MSAALQERFDAACALARQAGALALGLQSAPGRPVGRLKGAQDWLTEADGAVERFLAERLGAQFPDDDMLGEEEGERSGSGRSGLRWIIDPIDGTSNYARGRPRWCVSIGLHEADSPVLGVLDCPAAGEQFRARRGGGATLNGAPITHSGCDDLSLSMIEYGWSPRSDRALYGRTANALLATGAMPRAGGSGALGLADVACGRIDAFIELHIQLWDVAAAMALLIETGCLVDHGGFPGPIVAAAPRLGLDLARLRSFDEQPDGVTR